MNNKRINSVVSWIVVFIFPLYSLPWVVIRMSRLEKSAFVQFAFFMGLVGMLYPPAGDMAKYYRDYVTYQGLDFNEFLILALLNLDYSLSFLLYGLTILNIPCDISRFIFNSLGIFLLGRVYLQLVLDNAALQNKKVRIYALIAFAVFSISSSLYRFGLATNLFIYGAYYIQYKDKNRYWFFIILSILTHFTFIIFAGALLLNKYWPLRIKSRFVYYFLLFFLLFGIFNVGVMFDVTGFSGAVFERYKGYLDTADSGQYAKGFSLKYLLWLGFSNFIVIVCYWFFMKFRKGDIRERSYNNYLIVLTCIVSPFSVVFGRFLGLLGCFLKYYFFRSYTNTTSMRRYLSLLLCLTIILDGMNLWAQRREISVSDMSLLFAGTSYSVLTHQYTDNWFSRNITELGEVIKYE